MPVRHVGRLLLATVLLAACGAGGEMGAEDHRATDLTSPATQSTTTVGSDGSSPAPDVPTGTTGEKEEREVPPPSNPPGPEPVEGVIDEIPPDLLGAMLAEASAATGSAESTLVVVRASRVDWPDGSLGCPEPGMSYVQVITPGYWVQIQGPSELLDYRASDAGFFRRCVGTGTPHSGSDGVGGETIPPPAPES